MPPSDLSSCIFEVFASVLPGEVDADTDFFDAGGDSMAAEQVLMTLSSRLGLDLPGWLLLDHPTVTSLSAALSDIMRG